jgi:hypothetical protein
MKYPYDANYQPPFPVVQVVFHNSEEGLHTTAVPIAYLQQIFAPALIDTRIRSHWGEWRSAQLFVVDLELDGLRLPSVLVVGDEQGDEIVLGRNVLNELCLFLDGPANLTEILSQ